MSENNKSLINEVSVYNTKILFSGDIEEIAEHDMLKKLSCVDILKVPHHGSETSSSMNFLEVIKPKTTFFSPETFASDSKVPALSVSNSK